MHVCWQHFCLSRCPSFHRPAKSGPHCHLPAMSAATVWAALSPPSTMERIFDLMLTLNLLTQARAITLQFQPGSVCCRCSMCVAGGR